MSNLPPGKTNISTLPLKTFYISDNKYLPPYYLTYLKRLFVLVLLQTALQMDLASVTLTGQH
jgi:hypothetical protein